MDNKGNVLFKSKTDSLKGGIVFLLLGFFMIVGSNFIYEKMMVVILGSIVLLIGLYLLVFKGADNIIIYENGIVLSGKKNQVIDKNDIKSIAYKKLKPKRAFIPSYYAVLLLNNGSEQFINIAFNSVINKDYEKIIKSYLD
ncbi:hypothetical protein [Pseudolactococcus reticulitermitis]|uniref:Uncharacterized protein n=1 Tax=Pseudolactococcus reticulitermitis TaxID=2025039 RepID=A0A224X8P2_9LACT|nr:hypothetical protein [Lactococcus reticulitermitis]GAX46594.1 hypothetical protein RsY01_173 [Lactococcus reticulitermitis]